MEDYIVLCGAEFLKRHASSLVKVLDTIVANVNDKGLLSTLAIVDILIQVTSLLLKHIKRQVIYFSSFPSAIFFILFSIRISVSASSLFYKLSFHNNDVIELFAMR
jgi:hypothetical protein